MAKRRHFMDDWSKKPPDPNKLSRFTIGNDKYEREDLARLLKEMKEFDAYREKLADSKAGDLAYDIWQDLYLSFWKVDPEALPEGKIRPDHLVNRAVVGEAVDLPDFKELRMWTMGDDIGAALACNTIEPDVETLYDKLEEQMKMAQQLQELMQQMAQAQQDQRDLDQLVQEWTEQNPDADPNDQPTDWSEQQRQLQERMQQLQEQMDQTGQTLEEALKGAGPDIRATMKQAMRQANKDMENMNSMAESWGMEPGSLHRLPASERMELARKLNSDKFRRIAELFGPMKRLAFTEQRRKVNYAPEEIFDVELGNKIPRLLTTEIAKLMHPLRRLLFMKQYRQQQLMQYQMRGFERVAKGGIVFCHDGSGSMSGDKEMWAKALGLCLLHIARKQKRSFYAIQFGSPGQIRVDDFRDPQDITPEAVIDFAEFFFSGGTDFMSPLNRALSILQEEHQRNGSVKSDIVFATDGMCGVSDKWMNDFKEEQKRLGFRVWGVNIGGGVKDEPMYEICDGMVATIASIKNGEDVRTIFGNV